MFLLYANFLFLLVLWDLALSKRLNDFFIVIKNQQLAESLNRKDEEIRVMEERYRMYLAKAKNVCMQVFFLTITLFSRKS